MPRVVPGCLAWCALCTLGLACASEGYAPLGGGGATSTPNEPSIGGADAAASDRCGLPAGNAVCQCAELPFAEAPPTLWFVLDRSGSMARDDKWGLLRSVVLDVVARLGPRIQVAVAPFPRADDGDGQCTTGRIALTPRLGDRPAGSHGDTWNLVRRVLDSHPPTGGTPLTATLGVVADAIASRKDSGKHVVVLSTDGAPNCNAGIACAAAACVPNIESFEQCPSGGPPNCCDASHGGPLNCLDDSGAGEAVRRLTTLGVDTYVLGVPGSEPYAELLGALATLGGTAKTGTTRYYAATRSDARAFSDQLSSIAAKVLATCSIQLTRAPADLGLVNVLVDGVPLAPGDAGWSLAGDVVSLHGAACATVLAGEALDVRVVVGCPTVEVN